MAAHSDNLEAAYDYFKTAFPDATIIESAKYGDIRDMRLWVAGLALAEVVCSDGLTCRATYIIEQTRYTDALDAIGIEEEIGALPPGTHDDAVDAIASGDFEAQFGGYLL